MTWRFFDGERLSGHSYQDQHNRRHIVLPSGQKTIDILSISFCGKEDLAPVSVSIIQL